MSMTGGISFFEKNKALKKDGAACVASSNTSDQNLVLGTNKYFKWQSSGSDDSTTETLTITLPESVSVSRIFLLGHNFDTFTIKYGAGAGSNFANVTGLDAYSGNAISESGFTRDAAYYQFDAVTTNRFIVTATVAQTTDAEKELVQFVATNEIATLTGYPEITGLRFDRNDRGAQSVSGRTHIEKGYETCSFGLKLSSYNVQADITALESLHDRNEPFLVWLNGGKPSNFTYAQRGFRVGDVYQMQTAGGIQTGYYRNIYPAGVEQQYRFEEVDQ